MSMNERFTVYASGAYLRKDYSDIRLLAVVGREKEDRAILFDVVVPFPNVGEVADQTDSMSYEECIDVLLKRIHQMGDAELYSMQSVPNFAICRYPASSVITRQQIYESMVTTVGETVLHNAFLKLEAKYAHINIKNDIRYNGQWGSW